MSGGSLTRGFWPRKGQAGAPLRRWVMAALAASAAVALVLAGTVGVVRYVSTFWLYRGFPAPKLPHSVVSGAPGRTRQVRVVPTSLQIISVVSAALGGRPDRVYVVLPPGYAAHPRQRYPVLYLLHGFPGEPWGFIDIGGAADLEATLVAEGRMRPLILVMPTGTFSFLADEEWVNGVRRGNDWETFVARDLVNAIDTRYRTIASGGGRGLGGLSEGGYGALNIGLHHPGEFRLLESWSGYMYADKLPALFGRSKFLLDHNSPAKQVSTVAARLLADGTYIWFYCGSSDELAAQNRRFDAELTALGVAHDFFERPGTHDWKLWREMMPQALITASEHLDHG